MIKRLGLVLRSRGGYSLAEVIASIAIVAVAALIIVSAAVSNSKLNSYTNKLDDDSRAVIVGLANGDALDTVESVGTLTVSCGGETASLTIDEYTSSLPDSDARYSYFSLK